MLTLFRYNYDDSCTQGVLYHGDDYICDTLELPWKNNEKNISCIPEGSYEIWYRKSEAHKIKEGFVFNEVPGRTGAMIHPANSVKELLGCIAPGVKAGFRVENSRKAFKLIHDLIGRAGRIEIKRFKCVAE